MKRKHFARRVPMLQLHTLVFVVCTIALLYSIIATITYPGNAGVSFGVLKPFIIGHISLIIAWAALLLAHFGLHHLRIYLQLRAMYPDLNAHDAYAPERLRDIDDPDVEFLAEDGHEKRKRRLE